MKITQEEAKRFFHLSEEITKRRHETRVFQRELWEIIKKTRGLLTPREYKIIRMRFHEKKTLDEVKVVFEVTRERIKQIESKALVRLKEYSNQINKTMSHPQTDNFEESKFEAMVEAGLSPAGKDEEGEQQFIGTAKEWDKANNE